MADNAWQERLKTLGRNDECACGSKKKYKKCCLEADTKKQSEVLAAAQAEAKAKFDKELAEHEKNHVHGENCGHDHGPEHPHVHAPEHVHAAGTKPHAPAGAMKQVSAPRKVGSA